MRLLFAVSDHGYGHATRTVAILRETLRLRPDSTAVLLTGPGAAPLLHRSFEADARVAVLVRPSDPGLLLSPGSLRVDAEATETTWREWVRLWPSWVEELTGAVTLL